MALIKCPECGKEISDTCETCPHCGYRLKGYSSGDYSSEELASYEASNIIRREYRRKWIGGIVGGSIIILFSLILFILALVFSPLFNYHKLDFITFLILGSTSFAVGLTTLLISISRLREI